MQDVHNVRARKTDGGIIVNFHCRVSPAVTIAAAHDAVDRVERRLRSLYPCHHARDRARRADQAWHLNQFDQLRVERRVGQQQRVAAPQPVVVHKVIRHAAGFARQHPAWQAVPGIHVRFVIAQQPTGGHLGGHQRAGAAAHKHPSRLQQATEKAAEFRR